MTVAGATASNKLNYFLDFHEITVAGATASSRLGNKGLEVQPATVISWNSRHHSSLLLNVAPETAISWKSKNQE